MPDARPILAIAFPAILTQLATPIGQAYVTRAMAEYGEEAVAGMAIIGRMTPLAFGVLFAMSGAVGPIIGQNAGAGMNARVKEAFRDAMIFTVLVTVLVSGLLFAARPLWDLLFQLDGEARTLVFLFAGPLSLAFFKRGVQQFEPSVLFHVGQLGPPHAGHHSVCDRGLCLVWRIRRDDRAIRGGLCLCGDRLCLGAARDECCGNTDRGSVRAASPPASTVQPKALMC